MKIMSQNQYITMLGTGNALATKCYNTCFVIHTAGRPTLMVDAGGGNGVLTQLEKAKIPIGDITDLFVTHAHTDHLLGCIWMIRMALQFSNPLHIWSHSKVVQILNSVGRATLPAGEAEGIGEIVQFHCLESGEKFKIGDL